MYVGGGVDNVKEIVTPAPIEDIQLQLDLHLQTNVRTLLTDCQHDQEWQLTVHRKHNIRDAKYWRGEDPTTR